MGMRLKFVVTPWSNSKAHGAQRSEQWLKAPPEADQPQAEVGSKQLAENSGASVKC